MIVRVTMSVKMWYHVEYFKILWYVVFVVHYANRLSIFVPPRSLPPGGNHHSPDLSLFRSQFLSRIVRVRDE